MNLAGFTPDDFAVFSIPDFSARMQAIKGQVRPKLLALGEFLAPRLQATTGHAFYPHVALHARRRVNPPDDTWVAFARSPRGYKRYGHFSLGLSQHIVYVRFVVKAEADDKPGMRQALLHEGPGLFRRLSDPSSYFWYESDHPETGRPVNSLSRGDLLAMAGRLDQLKSSALAMGIEIPATDPAVADAEALSQRAVTAMQEMLPIYTAAVSNLT